jgi:hypothetical protein
MTVDESTDKMTEDKMTEDKMTVDEMNVNKMTVDKMTVDKMTVDEMTSFQKYNMNLSDVIRPNWNQIKMQFRIIQSKKFDRE